MDRLVLNSSNVNEHEEYIQKRLNCERLITIETQLQILEGSVDPELLKIVKVGLEVLRRDNSSQCHSLSNTLFLIEGK